MECLIPWARICKPFKEPRNRFAAFRTGTTTLFVIPARQATYAVLIDSSESIPGLLKRLQIRALVKSETRPFSWWRFLELSFPPAVGEGISMFLSLDVLFPTTVLGQQNIFREFMHCAKSAIILRSILRFHPQPASSTPPQFFQKTLKFIAHKFMRFLVEAQHLNGFAFFLT